MSGWSYPSCATGIERDRANLMKQHVRHQEEQGQRPASQNDRRDQNQDAEESLVLGLGSCDPDEDRGAPTDLI
jgi:hypothetical protein